MFGVRTVRDDAKAEQPLDYDMVGWMPIPQRDLYKTTLGQIDRGRALVSDDAGPAQARPEQVSTEK